MSNYGHYNHRYYGNKVEFHPDSFKIAGISHYEENAKTIKYNTILEIENYLLLFLQITANILQMFSLFIILTYLESKNIFV